MTLLLPARPPALRAALQCYTLAGLNEQAKAITWNNANVPTNCIEVDSGAQPVVAPNIAFPTMLGDASAARCCAAAAL